MKIEALEKIFKENLKPKKITIITSNNIFTKDIELLISMDILYSEKILWIDDGNEIIFVDIESIEIVKFI